jgi:hypothetical protein
VLNLTRCVSVCHKEAICYILHRYPLLHGQPRQSFVCGCFGLRGRLVSGHSSNDERAVQRALHSHLGGARAYACASERT